MDDFGIVRIKTEVDYLLGDRKEKDIDIQETQHTRELFRAFYGKNDDFNYTADCDTDTATDISSSNNTASTTTDDDDDEQEEIENHLMMMNVEENHCLLENEDPMSMVKNRVLVGWKAYNDALDEFPLVTKACTSLVGFMIGDLLAQICIVKTPGIDMKRLITISMFGFLWHGPSCHYFYNWLDEKIPGTESKILVTKIMIDQLLWCPIFLIIFFTYLGVVAEENVSTIEHKIRSDLFTAVLGSWKVWPLAHIINFKFIHTKHRLAYINSIQIAFNIFLSIIGSK